MGRGWPPRACIVLCFVLCCFINLRVWLLLAAHALRACARSLCLFVGCVCVYLLRVRFVRNFDVLRFRLLCSFDLTATVGLGAAGAGSVSGGRRTDLCCHGSALRSVGSDVDTRAPRLLRGRGEGGQTFLALNLTAKCGHHDRVGLLYVHPSVGTVHATVVKGQ